MIWKLLENCPKLKYVHGETKVVSIGFLPVELIFSNLAMICDNRVSESITVVVQVLSN